MVLVQFPLCESGCPARLTVVDFSKLGGAGGMPDMGDLGGEEGVSGYPNSPDIPPNVHSVR